MNIISALKDLTTLIVLWLGAKIAWEGLYIWKEQIRGNTEYDLAKRTLKAVYKVRDALESVRFWIMSSSEYNNARVELLRANSPESGSPPPEPTRQDLTRMAYSVRWREVTAASQQLHEEYVEAEAVWGKEAKDLLLDIQNSVNRLGVALDAYLTDDQLSPEDRKMFKHEVINMSGNVPDEFSKELDERIEKIEKFVRPMLQIRSTKKRT